MIEGARRHGHFDPRWHTEGLRPRNGKVDRLSMIRTSEVSPSIHRWENEGGRCSITDEPNQEMDRRTEDPAAGLEWYAFLSRYFPYRRRHDHQALNAYEAYRSKAVAPSTSPLTAVVTSRASVIRRNARSARHRSAASRWPRRSDHELGDDHTTGASLAPIEGNGGSP